RLTISSNVLLIGRRLSSAGLKRSGLVRGQRNGGSSPGRHIRIVTRSCSGLDNVLYQIAALADTFGRQPSIIVVESALEFNAIGGHAMPGHFRGHFPRSLLPFGRCLRGTSFALTG